MKRAETAVALLDEGYNCAQSVLAAFADTLDLDRETALRLADPFGGGMMLPGGPCGAVTGALLALGLAHGGTAADDDEANERVRELTREFHRRFRARRGTASCTELLGADISRAEVFAQAKADEIFADTCPDSVRAAAEILVDMLRERGESEMTKLVTNAAGREVPVEINGGEAVPFKGVGGHRPASRKAAPPVATCIDYPVDGHKVVKDLKTALQNAGLQDGMTVSSHHHLRNGDYVANAVFAAAAELGVKDLRWFPSASFPCHAPLIELLDSGVIHHIEGSMNGPLGAYCSEGRMRGMGVLRSHGGRWQAVQDGEVHIDIAVIAAPTADPFGNRTGDRGPTACGLLGFALADSIYADHVIVATDNLVDFPCIPWQIQGNNVDQVVVMDSIGDASKIVSGTTEITRSPDRLLIAELTARFCDEAGIVRDGFSFQAGAGGTALSFALFLRDMMRERGIKARFVRGGSTQYLVDMLEEGLTDYILDGQTFDLEGVRSMRENPGHVNTSPFTSYNWHGKGNFASMLDAVVLGATEVDVGFNANVVTHSDGRLLHGIGGWMNCLTSKCTILPVPSFRDRIPVLVDRVTTLCGPGELIDVIVTERGIAINPQRRDLVEAMRGSSLPIQDIHELKHEVEEIVGGAPAAPDLGEKVVAAIKWVDGTVIDCVREVRG